jgi:hypothetical protein
MVRRARSFNLRRRCEVSTACPSDSCYATCAAGTPQPHRILAVVLPGSPQSHRPSADARRRGFPPVGQREYRARMSPAPTAGYRPRVYHAPPARNHASPACSSAHRPWPSKTIKACRSQYPQTGAHRCSMAPGAGGANQRSHAEAQRSTNNINQDADLPVFFNRERS